MSGDAGGSFAPPQQQSEVALPPGKVMGTAKSFNVEKGFGFIVTGNQCPTHARVAWNHRRELCLALPSLIARPDQ